MGGKLKKLTFINFVFHQLKQKNPQKNWLILELKLLLKNISATPIYICISRYCEEDCTIKSEEYI